MNLNNPRLALRRVLVLALMTAFCALVLAAAARADIERTFTIDGVGVDVTARTADRARSMAIAEGQREALTRLFDRLTLRDDAARLPVLDNPSVTNLVTALEFSNEKTSSKRYISDLTVHFSPERVRNLLRVTGIPFSETAAKPVLVLPVYEVGGLAVLWNDPNPWRDAWRRFGERGGLLPLIVPDGDLSDAALFSARDALNPDRRRLAAISDKYGVSEVLIARATQGYKSSGRAPVLKVLLQRIGNAGEVVEEWSFEGESADDRVELLQSAADSLAYSLEEEWKLQTLIEFGAEITLEATVPLGGLADWLEIQARLGQIASIRRIELMSISVLEAQVVLHFLGNPDQLILALAQSDVDLVSYEGAYSIVLAPDGVARDEPGLQDDE